MPARFRPSRMVRLLRSGTLRRDANSPSSVTAAQTVVWGTQVRRVGGVAKGSTDTKEGDGTTNIEPELRRERTKQSNRESTQRSRLRKQQECEELARKLTDLNSENNVLRIELENLKKLSGELEVENKSIMVELKETYGSEFLSGLGSLH